MRLFEDEEVEFGKTEMKYIPILRAVDGEGVFLFL